MADRLHANALRASSRQSHFGGILSKGALIGMRDECSFPASMTPRTRFLIVAAIALLFISGTATAVYCVISYLQGKSLYARAYRETLSGHYPDAIVLYTAATHKILDPTTRALAYGNRGWCFAKLHNDTQAIRDFTESIRIDSRPVYSVLDRGLAYHRKGEFEKALADYDTAISKDPNVIDALYYRGVIFANRGEWTKAIADFTEAIRCQPDNPQLFVDRGMAYAALKQLDAAIANFDSALSFDPIDADAFIQRADAYRRKGDPRKGLADVTEAIREMPKRPGLYYARAIIYLDRGAIDEGIVDCNEALRLEPDYDLGYLARARAYLHKRDWEKCLNDADAALKITNSEWGHYLRGRALTARGEFDEAISEFDQALALSPVDTWAIIFRAANYAYRSEYTRALDDLKKAVERFPGVATAHYGLAWFLATCPNDAYRDGAQAIAEATKTCDLSDWKAWWALDALAVAYAEHGEFDEAIRYVNMALDLPNASPQERFLVEQRRTAYNYRIVVRDWPPSSAGHGALEEAMTAYAKRNYDLAIARLNLILPPNPGASITAKWFHFFDGSYTQHGFTPAALSDRRDLANAFYYRALSYEKKDELDNAIADFSTALSLEPDSTTCLRDRGFAYYQKSAYVPALEDFADVIRRNPDDALAYCYRAETLNAEHQRDAALEAVNTALRLDSKLGEGYFTRGWIYYARKEYDLALADFEKANWIEPNHWSTLEAKARTLAAKGNYQTAAHEFRAVAQRFRKSAEPRNAWAWFLATCPEQSVRNGAEAVIQARNACELSRWDNAAYLDTLAAAYAENGEFDQAVKYAMRALEKLPVSDPARPRLMQHLDFFRRKEAWRSKPDDE
jgi:tetratricopeptide (TPR) repeat protein